MMPEDRRRAIDRNRENRARQAQSFAKFESKGQGSIEFEKRVDFGLTFVEEPYVAFASELNMDELAGLLDLPEGESPPIPLTTGVVTEWDRDDRDFYVGAWVAVRIYFPEAVIVDELFMTHYFTFTAIAIKDIPTEGVD